MKAQHIGQNFPKVRPLEGDRARTYILIVSTLRLMISTVTQCYTLSPSSLNGHSGIWGV